MSEDYKKTYETFWKYIVELPNGDLNIGQVMRELHDFHMLLGNVSQVYMHVTGGRVSKQNTDPDVVCQLADEHYQEIFDEEIKELREIWEEENIKQDMKIAISGSGSLTCDLAGNHTACPPDCHGTGGCSPRPIKYSDISFSEFYGLKKST